jgi:glycosyltransferase involved in cell wall biosynthesis
VCVEALEANRSLGVAYTSLYYHRPDGTHGLSAWPDQWVYDDQLLRKNQIPTACVFRREAWERTGGYRQRYAPGGAGEEDAEFWTRLGAYGYKAEQVEPHATLVPKYLDLKARAARIPSPQQMADAGLAKDWPLVESSLFHYSWESGQVSGDKTRRSTDWLAWHPWVKDGQHPLASYATPSNHRHPSHPVRQYDEPMVSVIIPVGPGHEKTVIDALDSLEAQTFRKWEAIVVWDSKVDPTDILDAYPYVNWQTTELNKSGAGHARNVGTRYARAPFLFFLDADDWLYPEALEKHIDAWAEGKPAVIYSDYVGKAIGVDPKGLADDIEVLHYFQHNDEYVLGYRAADYDCEHAQRQPELPRPFIWCNVTALVPKSWHEKIGGFDEAMESWEDVDYHWRLARAGYCYRRIPERLMVYRFYTGSRRDSGLQKHKSLVQYLRQKYEGLKIMPCSGCGGSARRRKVTSVKATTAPAQRAASPPVGSETVAISDDEFVLIRLADGNRGDHPVIGFNTKRKYGHHQDGQKFLMDHRDVFTVNKRSGKIVLVSEFFQPVEERPLNLPQEEKPAPPPPEPMTDDVPEETTPDVWDVARPLDLQTIPGVNKDIADELAARGLTSAEAILEVGEEELVDIKGIGPFKAKKIIGHLTD